MLFSSTFQNTIIKIYKTITLALFACLGTDIRKDESQMRK